MRRVLLDREYVYAPDGQSSPSLLYIYSKADKKTLWRDVEAYARKAREKGGKIREIVFDDSAHCVHVVAYPETYALAVGAMWNLGLRDGSGL